MNWRRFMIAKIGQSIGSVIARGGDGCLSVAINIAIFL